MRFDTVLTGRMLAPACNHVTNRTSEEVLRTVKCQAHTVRLTRLLCFVVPLVVQTFGPCGPWMSACRTAGNGTDSTQQLSWPHHGTTSRRTPWQVTRSTPALCSSPRGRYRQMSRPSVAGVYTQRRSPSVLLLASVAHTLARVGSQQQPTKTSEFFGLPGVIPKSVFFPTVMQLSCLGCSTL